jgi:hypothetical protein
VTVFRAGEWLPFDRASGQPQPSVWAGMPAPGCIPLLMDYDGDLIREPTQFCSGAWHFYNEDGSYNKGIWTGGMPGDQPAPADYDGDGDDDVVLFRNGAWLYHDFATGAYVESRSVWTGAPPHWQGGTPLAVPVDHDGDGRAEFTVFSGGAWHFFNDDGSYYRGIWTGADPADIPVPADYDGDGDDDIVVFRDGAWLLYDLATVSYVQAGSVWTGAPPDFLGGVPIPAPVDPDGDGRFERSVFSGGPWHFFNDDGSYSKGIWTGGMPADVPVVCLWCFPPAIPAGIIFDPPDGSTITPVDRSVVLTLSQVIVPYFTGFNLPLPAIFSPHFLSADLVFRYHLADAGGGNAKTFGGLLSGNPFF